MKRFFVLFLIVMGLVCFSGTVYAQNAKEIIVEGTIPSSWGTLRQVMRGSEGYMTRLYFEAQDGTIRIAYLVKETDFKYRLGTEDGRINDPANVLVIKRRK
ncbi:MAG: hypothetical protein WCO89_03745 [Syntrophus sp. (in: bacteria)]